ncbi:hypothetical protein [Shewanella aestuarii]|uniref:hypothetical protein n=1 Tax=Shewanella aestuarii TaxID=1028752 RepID=UPI001FCBF140|nr:hypothetical protein [Shewanella aestuarii]
MKYVLPIADGKNGDVDYLYQKRPVSSWNPLKSGVTSIELSPFSHFRELDVMQPLPTRAIGTDVLLKWDNRDSANNSTKGGQTSFKWTQGFAVDDVANWSKWEFEQSAFFSLGSNKIFDEQVIASNVFIADTPTWNDYDRSTKDYQRPPSFVGVFLGGFNRSRGYSSKEYTGRSAINYALEYRVKPKWQPLQDWPLFNLYQVPWWQWTVFAEAGQVSDEFNLQSLHQDMLFTVGAGVRFEIEQMVVRADFAKGSEQSQFWVMVNQTF